MINPLYPASEPSETPDAGCAYDTLGELYDEWVHSVVDDIPFYRGIADNAGRIKQDQRPHRARVLELGAGSGRVTLPLLAAGHEVTAVDVAGDQLARLQGRAHDAGSAHLLTIMHDDMRTVLAAAQPHSFDTVIAPFRCLLHVAHDAPTLFTHAHRALRPGGVLAFDVFHPPSAVEGALAASWQLRRRVKLQDGEWAIRERAASDPSGEQLRLYIRCDGPAGEQREAVMHLQTPPPHWWRDALGIAGLELLSVHAWFDGEPFNLDACDSVWVARAPFDT